MSIEKDDISPTLRAQMAGHPPVVCYKPIAVLGGGREHSTICIDGTAPTLCTFQDSKPILIARIDNAEKK